MDSPYVTKIMHDYLPGPDPVIYTKYKRRQRYVHQKANKEKQAMLKVWARWAYQYYVLLRTQKAPSTRKPKNKK